MLLTGDFIFNLILLGMRTNYEYIGTGKHKDT